MSIPFWATLKSPIFKFKKLLRDLTHLILFDSNVKFIPMKRFDNF